jgi:hypothetical protein
MVLIYKPTPITVLGLMPKLLAPTSVVVDLDDLGAEVIRDEGRSRLTYGLGDVAKDQPGDDVLDAGVMGRPPGLGHMR